MENCPATTTQGFLPRRTIHFKLVLSLSSAFLIRDPYFRTVSPHLRSLFSTYAPYLANYLYPYRKCVTPELTDNFGKFPTFVIHFPGATVAHHSSRDLLAEYSMESPTIFVCEGKVTEERESRNRWRHRSPRTLQIPTGTSCGSRLCPRGPSICNRSFVATRDIILGKNYFPLVAISSDPPFFTYRPQQRGKGSVTKGIFPISPYCGEGRLVFGCVRRSLQTKFREKVEEEGWVDIHPISPPIRNLR